MFNQVSVSVPGDQIRVLSVCRYILTCTVETSLSSVL